MNRRDFLGIGFGAAVLPVIGDGSLNVGHEAPTIAGPLVTVDSPILGKVKFTKLTIDVGAERPFKVIHCSDTHLALMNVSDLLCSKRVKDFAMFERERKDMAEAVSCFAACVLKAKLEGVPLIHTGDVWDFHSPTNGEYARDAFAVAGNVLYAMGNHEIRGHWEHEPNIDNEGVRRRYAKYLPNDSLVAARVIGGVNFVAFDNCANWGGVQRGIHPRLRAEFAKGLPVVLVMHKPIMTPESRKWCVVDHHAPEKNLRAYLYAVEGEEREFVDWALKQPNLKAVLCGHFHNELQWRLSDTVTQYVAGAAYRGNAYEITFK